ncbi:MAG: 50S ribosome-binding GTPase [Planctomycetes bacterium]|nr:50S ribosome-binding GTPase [Planctomycetota bacterium]
MPYFSHDTIAQIASPPGPGLVGAVRISGPDAFVVLSRTTRGLGTVLADRPHRGLFPCRFLVALAGPGAGGRQQSACPARAALMPAPASYTREDVAEIFLPGVPVLLRAALATVLQQGCRGAAPGEFTFRAFRNGRITLGQAEAVERVVRAATDAERRLALARLGDRDRIRILAWRGRALDLAARVEAALDFAETEPDVEVASGLAGLAADLAVEADAVVDGSSTAGVLPEAALVGRANVGKSSLFNALTGGDHVLVSPVAATTRDRLRREVDWDGCRLFLADTPGVAPDALGAGLDSADRAVRCLAGQAVTCWVVDGSRPLQPGDEVCAAHLAGSTVVVAVTQSDRPPARSVDNVPDLLSRHGVTAAATIGVSAVTGEGIPALRAALCDRIGTATAAGEWSRRERDELSTALTACRTALRELSGPARLELAAEDLRAATAAFSRALGEGYAEETLGRIFSTFCIGK